MTCTHHWMIEPPNGKTSKGVCKNCNEEKDFFNASQVKTSWRRTTGRGKGHGLTKAQLEKKIGPVDDNPVLKERIGFGQGGK